MATITFVVKVPDSKMADVRDTCAYKLGYQETINGEPNPQSRKQFLEGKVAAYIKAVYQAGKADEAAESARQAAMDEAATVLIEV